MPKPFLKPSFIAVTAIAIVAFVGGGMAYAATTSATVKVCVTKKNVVRAAAANSKCPKGTKAVDINKVGHTGRTGAPGVTGPTGATGPAGAPGSSIGDHYELVEDYVVVQPGQGGAIAANCSRDKHLLSGTAHWLNGRDRGIFEGTSLQYVGTTTASALGLNTSPITQTLVVQAICTKIYG